MRTSGPATLGGDDSTGSSSTSDASSSSAEETATAPNTDSGEAACTPGQQVECPCVGGAQGVQLCADDGSSFLPCECPESATTTGPSGETGNEASTGEPPEACAALECGTCQVCVQEEGVDCQAEIQNCASSRDCVGFVECVGGCADQSCQQECAVNAGEEGVEAYNALAACILTVCTDCEDGG